jgi:adenylate cyclase
LFADVKGSMELSEQVDPEEWHAILDRFFQVLTEGVHRFEGTINQYTGDGIMALFGAPIAHENHAQRACYAALHLEERLRSLQDELRLSRGIDFQVRMGIHSGEVVVGKIGDDLRMDYTAQGHTVGLAARMEEVAAANTICVSAATEALVSGFFELRSLGATSVKGASEPVRVFELERVAATRTRFDLARARGLSRFVGRGDDLNTLDAALARASEGNGQVVGVVGNAGVGKSRLCFEFAERCRARGLRVLEGRALGHGKHLPLLPILQALRAYFGITEQDSDREAREKIAGRMLLLGEEHREVLPPVFEFLGAADPANPAPRMDSESRQHQLFSVLRRLVQRDGGEGPIVTLIEDLHWIDGASDAWIAEWADAIADSHNLLVVNFRPEYHAAWMQKSWYHQLPLSPLGAEALRQLLDDLLGLDPSVQGLAEAIHARTSGNPFFTEEAVQSLIESGHLEGTRGSYRLLTPVERLEVPAAVQSVLAARIDRLPEREKRILQIASVIGEEFAEPILQAVAELPEPELAEALGELRRAEFIYERALYPVAGYAFKHPLTREVALETQLRARSRALHAAVAKAFEESDREKLDERAALIAHHREEAGEGLAAAHWHRRAAEWVGESDFAQAFEHWRKVRWLARAAPGSEESRELRARACGWMLAVGWRTGIDGEEAAALLAEGRAAAEQIGDLNLLWMIVDGFGVVHMTAGEVTQGQAACREALAIAEAAGDAKLVAKAHSSLIGLSFAAGTLGEALAHCDHILSALSDDFLSGIDEWGSSTYVWSLARRGAFVLAPMGRPEEGLRDLERALELAHQVNQRELIGWIQSAHGEVARWADAPGPLLARARQGLEIAEGLGSPLSTSLAYALHGTALLACGEGPEAARCLERALVLARERGVWLHWEGSMAARLAAAHLASGESARALETARAAVAIAQRRGTPGWEGEAQLSLARALRAEGGRAARSEIDAALTRAAELIERTHRRALLPSVHEEWAALAALEGDAGVRERELREAHRLFTEMGATGHAERLAREFES